MDNEKFTAFLQEYWYIVSLAAGAVVLIGSILDWNWLCDPIGTPRSHRYGRGFRRAIFFLLGAVLIVTGVWGIVLRLKQGG